MNAPEIKKMAMIPKGGGVSPPFSRAPVPREERASAPRIGTAAKYSQAAQYKGADVPPGRRRRTPAPFCGTSREEGGSQKP
jgi:hypothetical protein